MLDPEERSVRLLKANQDASSLTYVLYGHNKLKDCLVKAESCAHLLISSGEMMPSKLLPIVIASFWCALLKKKKSLTRQSKNVDGRLNVTTPPPPPKSIRFSLSSDHLSSLLVLYYLTLLQF
ncbi:hypothetical protein CEXT_649941 [Caerostris extrusa]|uniref:Uncharacterized protein n=1 Tax=Caerostris extrusa TaxID=172846 RepID=A0AAV4M5S9_CAEEX|nr:hypothetical protein CEXT_649941 [Caerostris extrusa]